MRTFNEKEIALATNAIGWVFFGDRSEDGMVVEISEEDSQMCSNAAKRALEHIERYREDNKELNDNDEAPEYSDASYE